MLHKRILQNIVQTVADVDDVGIGIQFPNIPLHEEPPLFFRIDDLAHLCLTNQHLLLYEPLRFHLSHLDIHTALVTKVLLRRIKNLFVFRQRLCKHARQEAQSCIRQFIPIRKGFECSRLLCLQFLLERLAFCLERRLQ